MTSGVYGLIRHPMYAAHLLWAVAQVLMLYNRVAGYSFVVVAVPQYLFRVGIEEQMMRDQFGEAYGTYMARTGRIIPLLKRRVS